MDIAMTAILKPDMSTTSLQGAQKLLPEEPASCPTSSTVVFTTDIANVDTSTTLLDVAQELPSDEAPELPISITVTSTTENPIIDSSTISVGGAQESLSDEALALSTLPTASLITEAPIVNSCTTPTDDAREELQSEEPTQLPTSPATMLITQALVIKVPEPSHIAPIDAPVHLKHIEVKAIEHSAELTISAGDVKNKANRETHSQTNLGPSPSKAPIFPPKRVSKSSMSVASSKRGESSSKAGWDPKRWGTLPHELQEDFLRRVHTDNFELAFPGWKKWKPDAETLASVERALPFPPVEPPRPAPWTPAKWAKRSPASQVKVLVKIGDAPEDFEKAFPGWQKWKQSVTPDA